jgi:PLP dependent protein
MERAALRAGRRTEDITLVGISKTHAAGSIREAYDAGVRHFGENRVQEWESKKAALADLDAAWHMVGHVQSNKAGRAVRLFHSIDSVDSVELAVRLDKARRDCLAEGTEEDKAKSPAGCGRLRVLIEVKLDSGSAKSGVSADELPRLAEALMGLPHLELAGLMGVPPYFEEPERARPYFRRLCELRDALRVKFGGELLPVLSMGMSQDFEVAIEEGATQVRVGTALFGVRPKI